MAGGKLNQVIENCPVDPTPEFIKSAMFDSPRTNTQATISVEAFMQPRSLLGLSIFLNEVIADFLVLGLVDGKLPKKGSAPEDKVKFLSAFFGDLSDWPPTFQMVGDSDEAWDASQLTSLHDKLRKHNIPSGVLVVPEKSHAFENMSKIGDQLHLRYIQPACEFVTRYAMKNSEGK
ncbi:uncharacterized protein A1O5_13314 [Cladophialophora psammophila CBS 110553]|uniref:Peptidase S9 prolyl oligopeptidase catalytic domain-containing protein n=1 Tax=Cladophialophora psammophila CBS 110553 TaxID=1182543 RepID=W9VMU0_9EURO|nr:uncharacterized protein A1O5_13314 [Cladophialophora psammophila CBS 110553]EXJ53446.1 hypothetical protein A1O5_13314 [Cladophialophora psammophila CBS 110553]